MIEQCGGGGAEGNRTPDLYNAIVALSQLSYGPKAGRKIGCSSVAGKQKNQTI